MKYEVTLHVIVQHTLVVEADSAYDAELNAAEELRHSGKIDFAYSGIEVTHIQEVA